MLSKKLKSAIGEINEKNIEQTLADIESVKEDAFNLRKSGPQETENLRKVAEIPLALYNRLPESIKKDQHAFEKWLRNHKEFWIVEKL